MNREEGTLKRSLNTVTLNSQLVVTGGGLSGVCCAITAARLGLQVALIQDRPVLGGNSSSEVRLWVLGATSHMGNNNRWAREGGVIDELLVENMHRNPEGNPLIFDTIILEKVSLEKNITLMLNTAVFDVQKKDESTITRITAFCSQNSTLYQVNSPLFCDASGDGIIGFLAGAAFRMGAEAKDEFDEKFAPSHAYGELLGHSLYFYTKDTGKPVKFVPPAFALNDITKIPRFKSFNTKDQGCRLWWIEYGGRLDTVHETEKIKWELWKVVYGVWNYIKNSGEFPDSANLTLEWVGHIPGKRESRRFEGDYMLKQQDIVNQQTFKDAVTFGGWSIDLHPADGVFSELPGCNQWHSKGIYQIPYRCLYSKNIKNLFLAGRIISSSHVAFGSTRVMATSATTGQVAAVAAKICNELSLQPRDLMKDDNMKLLQQLLLKTGQYIPGVLTDDKQDLVQQASIIASSELSLNEIPADDSSETLMYGAAQMLPMKLGKFPQIEISGVTAIEDTKLEVTLRKSSKCYNHTPDTDIQKLSISLNKGTSNVMLNFDHEVDHAGYYFICLHKNEKIKISYGSYRYSGILSVFNKSNPAVSNYGAQKPEGDIGMDAFEFWCPERRPAGKNIAMKIQPGLQLFPAKNISNGWSRPVSQPNAWVAALEDKNPKLEISWTSPQQISIVQITFDTDYDHPMETVLQGHPETDMPFCVKNYKLKDDRGNVLVEVKDNHQSRNIHRFEKPINTSKIFVEVMHPSDNIPAALFEVRCY